MKKCTGEYQGTKCSANDMYTSFASPTGLACINCGGVCDPLGKLKGDEE